MTEEEIERRLRASLAAMDNGRETSESKSAPARHEASADEIAKKLARDMNAAADEKKPTPPTQPAEDEHITSNKETVTSKPETVTSKTDTVTTEETPMPVVDETKKTEAPKKIEPLKPLKPAEPLKPVEPAEKTEKIEKVDRAEPPRPIEPAPKKQLTPMADKSKRSKQNKKEDGDRPSALKILRDGIIDNNPVFVQLLGMCSTLATTTSVKNALGMGLATSAVLICSNIMISLLRRIIPKEVRIAAYVVIISGFVTAVELLMKAYLYDLYEALGIFIPLIVVNCIILARAEAFASKNGVAASALDGVASGAGYTLALFLTASVREILGSGSWMGINILGSGYPPAVIFVLPAGAFLTIGFLLAVVQKFRNTSEDRARMRRLSDISVNTKGKPAADMSDDMDELEEGISK